MKKKSLFIEFVNLLNENKIKKNISQRIFLIWLKSAYGTLKSFFHTYL